MRKWLCAGLFLIAALLPSSAQQTKAQLNTDVSVNLPDNTSGLITPLALRTLINDVIASFQQAASVNAQTGTPYTLVVADFGRLVTFSASPTAVTLPQAIGSFSNYNVFLKNVGGGTVTVTPTVSTIDGVASLAIPAGGTAWIVSNGSNYVSYAGSGGGGGGGGSGTVTNITCGNGLSGGSITTSGTCAQYFDPGSITNCTLSSSAAANLLTVTLVTQDGSIPSASKPCFVAFRSATATTGDYTVRSVTAATSISTFAVGATLGSPANTAFRFWVTAFDNAGSVVLALYNASTATSCQAITEGTVQSSTAMTSAATAAQVFYTPNGTTLTNKAVRAIGYVEYNSAGLATAGTYASAPNFVQMLTSGLPKPCETVQVRSFLGGAQASTVSAAYQNSNSTINITPTSAANPILFKAFGNPVIGASYSVSPQFRVHRGATAIGPVASFSSSVALSLPTAFMGIDLPNSIAAQTYLVKFKSDGTNVVFYSDANAINYIEVVEIMG